MPVPLDLLAGFPVGPLQCNCYIVGDRAALKAIVIDPGGDADAILDKLAQASLEVTAIVATHAHFDHILAAERLRNATGAPFLLHDADKTLLGWMRESVQLFLGQESPPPPAIDSAAREGDIVRAGSAELQIIHTPGHSPGSISLVADDAVFSGDTLFAGSIGRTDLPGGDHEALLKAVRAKLFTLDESLAVYPGHGPATTLASERRSNPFVGDRARSW